MLLTIPLTAESNSEPTFKGAWGDLGKTYINSRGHLCIPNELVGSTRLLMWNYYFYPHPFDNRYNDDMLTLESKIEYFKFEVKLVKRRTRKLAATWAGISSAATLVICILIFK